MLARLRQGSVGQKKSGMPWELHPLVPGCFHRAGESGREKARELAESTSSVRVTRTREVSTGDEFIDEVR